MGLTLSLLGPRMERNYYLLQIEAEHPNYMRLTLRARRLEGKLLKAVTTLGEDIHQIIRTLFLSTDKAGCFMLLLRT